MLPCLNAKVLCPDLLLYSYKAAAATTGSWLYWVRLTLGHGHTGSRLNWVKVIQGQSDAVSIL